MRKATKTAVGILSLGVLATSWSIGQASETNGFTSNYAGVAADSPSPSSSPSQSISSSAAPSQSAGSKQTSKPKATATPSTSPTPAKPKAAGNKSKTGDAQSYRYGVIQVTVTKTGSKITDISLDQAGATGGRQAAFDPLVNAAIQAQGSSFGNVGGATYTTETFKTALESALAKF